MARRMIETTADAPAVSCWIRSPSHESIVPYASSTCALSSWMKPTMARSVLANRRWSLARSPTTVCCMYSSHDATLSISGVALSGGRGGGGSSRGWQRAWHTACTAASITT